METTPGSANNEVHIQSNQDTETRQFMESVRSLLADKITLSEQNMLEDQYRMILGKYFELGIEAVSQVNPYLVLLGTVLSYW